MIDRDFIKAQIDAVRESIGRMVTVYYPLPVAEVYIDPVDDTSFQKQYESEEILARVHWTSNEAMTMTPGGRYYVGEASITVDPEHLELLRKAQNGGKVVVDGLDMNILRINPLGAPEINRVRAILKGTGDRPDQG